jgi:hypothetical protein
MKLRAVAIAAIVVLSVLALGAMSHRNDIDQANRSSEPSRAFMAVAPARAETAPDAGWLARVREEIARMEYEPSENDRGLQAPNRRHNLRTYFEPTGIEIFDRTAEGNPALVGMRLVGLGRGDSLVRAMPGEVVDEGSRVEVRRPGLVEWYVNGPEGVEQGFNLDERPSGEGSLALELSVEHARAALRADGVRLTTPTGRRLDYAKLAVFDAESLPLAAHFALSGDDSLRIVIDDAEANYPIVVDPLLTEVNDSAFQSDQTNAELGQSVAAAGDVNGDGYGDIIVGAPFFDDGDLSEGAAWVFHGSASGIPDGDPVTADAEIQSNQFAAVLGESVAGAGDVNGDGYDDVIVGASGYEKSLGRVDEGGAFVFHGGPSGIGNGTPSNADAELNGGIGGINLGIGVAGAGDVNGDGYDDVIVGAWQYEDGSSPQFEEGAAFIFHGGPSGIGDQSALAADTELVGNQIQARMGWNVAAAGDVNGDGFSDVMVSAPWWESTGAQSEEGGVFIYHGSASGVPNGDPTTADTIIQSNQFQAYLGGSAKTGIEFGRGISGAGDVNGDGYGDVIIGSYWYDQGQSNEGIALVFHGSASGVPNGDPSTADALIQSNQADGLLGNSVAGVGDVNGDGYSDVVIGAPGLDSPGANSGAALVMLGSPLGIADANPTTADFLLSVQTGSRCGNASSGAGDVNGDGYADVLIGCHYYTEGQTHEGGAFVYEGGPEGILDGNPTTAATLIEAIAGDNLGTSVSNAGDVNGDGYSDIIVGAQGYDGGGGAFIFHGGEDGIPDGGALTADTVLTGGQANSRFGFDVDGAGDVNGDGYSDVIVGAYLYDAGQSNEGAAFIFHGSPTGVADGNPSTAATQLESDQIDGQLGWDVSGAGDVNGDGFADVVVGARFYDDPENVEGLVLVFLGGTGGVADGNPSTASARIESNQASGSLGFMVDSAGDVNGDGYADVIMGAPGYADGESLEGAAFIFHGGVAGITGTNVDDAATQLEANQGGARMGWSVAGLGDVNGDGFADVAACGYLYDSGQSSEGACFIFHGATDGIPDGNPTTADATLEGDQTGAFLGESIAGAGDVNGDGFDDVIVGAQFYDAGQSDEGAAFLFHGSATGIVSGGPGSADSQFESDEVNAHMAWRGLSSAGDINGDGFADVIVGADDYDPGGAAFVFQGNAGNEGRASFVRQIRGFTSETPIQPWGAAIAPDTFRVQMVTGHPLGAGLAKLEVEYCSSGVPFGDASCGTLASGPWVEVTAAQPEATLEQLMTELPADTLYRWRARALFEPSEPGGIKHGPWRRIAGQSNEGDIRVIPEPGFWGLLAAGIAMLGLGGRRARLRGRD